jgi:hypothetical protein
MVWRRDRECVVRWNEEEIERQESEHGAEYCGPEPSAERQDEGQQQVEEEHIEDAELSAKGKHRPRQCSHGHDGDEEPGN